jgi:TRAP-type C4-dicarboxylate transport system substrate-binding protein
VKNRLLLILLAVVLVVSLVAFAACKAEEAPPVEEEPPLTTFEFKFAGAITPGGDYEAFWQSWCDDIARLTNNRVKIKIYFGATLGPAADQLKMLDTGVADIVYHVPPWTPGAFPLSEGASLPFLTPTPTSTVQYGRYLVYWDKCTEYKNYKVIALGASPSGRLWFTNKKVTTLADMKGLRIRTGGGVIGLIPEALGAVNTPVPAVDLVMALERGTVDAVLIDPGYLDMIKGWEVLDYGIDIPFYLGTHQVLMSKKVWDSLPVDLQVIVDNYCQGTWSKWLEYTIDWEKRALANMTKGGTEIYSLDEAELVRWRQLLVPLVDSWAKEQDAKGIPASQAVEIARKLTFYEK